MSLFRFMGLWRADNESGFHKTTRNLLQLMVLAYYCLSLILAAYTSNDKDEIRFFAVGSIVVVNLTVRLYYILWKKDDILKLTSQIGTYLIKNREDFNRVNNKTNFFMKFATAMLFMNFSANIVLIIFKLPIFTNEKQLPLNFYFPFDWKMSEFRFWIVYAFVSYEMMLSATCTLLSIIIWYLMMSSATKYQLLCTEFREIGMNDTSDGTSTSFQQELMELIKSHKNLQEY